MESDNVESAFAKLSVAELDDDEVLEQVEGVTLPQPEPEEEFLAVGRLVTNRPVKFLFLKDTMATIWQPVMGMNAKELQPKLYLFRFFHERDISRIINDGPWTYEQSLLILRRIEKHEDPERVSLSHAEFWIQVHGLPAGLRSEAVLQVVGKSLGELVKLDENNFDGSLRMYYRIRVALSVAKPLKKGLRLKKDDGEWITVEFRYERLPTFCFLCGIIGHGEKVCAKMLDLDVKQKDRPFGSYLRAVNYRRGTPMTGEQWIAPETTADRKVWNATVKNAAVDGAGKGAESGGVRTANTQKTKQPAPTSPLKKDYPEASGKHTMGTHVPDQQPNGGDSVHASGKGKETVPLEMELGQVGPPHMGQTRTTPLNKGKRQRVQDENWAGPEDDCTATMETESLVQKNLLEAGLVRQARLEK